ncbi:Transcription regulator [Zea mays]|uniref:Transcription regulator n=1 Tax=Zea mays TaxID=4577 RepID=A0A1D6NB11_MAIZE|nr:Transcription regulator [Zea mays]
MASDTEGIAALFSMYNDDEEEEDADEPSPPFPALPAAVTSSSPLSPQAGAEDPNPSVAPPSPSRPEELASLKTLASPHPSPARGLLPPLPSRRSSSPFAVSSPSPLRGPFFAPPADLPRPPRRGALAIVDYAHDETAMSPEQEDGEITSNTYGFGSDAQAAEGNLEERTYSGTVHVMTPNTLAELSQHPDAPEQNQVGTDMAVDVTRTEIKGAQVEGTTDISTNGESDDPSNRFLPPPVTTKCSAALQQKINRFLAYRRAGKSFNAEVRNRKDYRNPDFLQHAVGYQEIDQIGTCFSKYVFDPYGYDKGDYYDEIEAEMKREVERKEQEKKRSPKVEFITGVQPPINASIPKIPEGVQKETRPNKKSKWDKVDGDVKNHVVPSGHDNLSATTAALLTSANVGAGYAGFA